MGRSVGLVEAIGIFERPRATRHGERNQRENDDSDEGWAVHTNCEEAV